ncbi:hypothetical protein GCM10027418_06680 [Mariniluteicoccus endophyticus]
MTEAIELASTYVSVGISTEGLGTAITSDKGGIGKAFARLGGKAGTAFKGQFETQSAGATKAAERDQDALAKAAQTAVGKVKAARDAEAAASRKVAIEEKKLQELRDAGAKDSQILVAEDRLANARTKQALATQRTAGEVDKLKAAQNELKAANAQTAQSATTTASKVKSAFASIGSPFAKLGTESRQAAAQVGRNLADSVRPATTAFSGLVSKARTSAVEAGQAFGTGLSTRARTALSGLDPFGGIVSKATSSATNAATAFGSTAKTRITTILAPLQPFAPVVASARSAAGDAGQALVNGITSRVRTGLSALNPLSALSGRARGEGDEAGQNFVTAATARIRGGLGGLNPFSGLRTQAAAAGVQSGESITGGIHGKVKGGLGALGGTLKMGLIGAAAAAGAAVGAAFTSSIDAASKLEQSIGGVGAIFKQNAGVIDAASQKAATGLGLSRNAYNELATVVGAGLKNKGITDFTGETQKLIGLGADLAAQFGGSTQEAVEAISSLMRGEADPIEKYGVAINETAINAELAARGQSKLEGAALEQAKAQARLAVLFRQTKDAQGAFARESDTFAGKQQRAAAQWEDLKTKIGGAFLPAMSSAMGFISAKGVPAIEAFGKAAAGVFDMFKTGDFNADNSPFGIDEDNAAIGIIFTLRDAFLTAKQAVSEFWAGWTLPADFPREDLEGMVLVGSSLRDTLSQVGATVQSQLMPILAQIGTLFGTVLKPAFDSLWQSVQINVIPAFMGLVGAVMNIYNTVGPIISQLVGTIVGQFQELSPQINGAMTMVGQIIGGAMNLISTAVGLVLGIIRGLWSMWGDNILALIRIVMSTVMGVIGGALNIVQGIIRTVMALITGDWQGAWNGVLQILSGIWDVIKAVVSGAIAAVQQVLLMAWDAIKAGLSAFGSFITGLWTGLWNGIKSFLMTRWFEIQMFLVTGRQFVEGIFDGIRNTVQAIWNGLWDFVKRVGNDSIEWVKGTIDRGLNAVKAFFQSGVDGIGRIWDGLRRAAGDPVRFVIDTVINNGIIKGWNELAGLLKLDNLKIKPVSVPGFWRGGVLPGPGVSSGDDMLVIDRAGRPQATVASGEPVISRRQYARNKPVVDAIMAGRKLPGFFLGGTLPTPGPVRPHRLPYYGATWAGDMGLGMGSPIYAWKDGVVANVSHKNVSYGNETNINHAGQSTKYAHQSVILVRPGDVVKAGQLIGRIGSTGKSTGPHLHFEVRGGNVNAADAGGSSGGFSPLAAMMGWVTDKLASPVRSLIDKIPGAGMFVDVAKGMGTRLLDSAVEKIKTFLPAGADPGLSGPAAPVSGSQWQVAEALMKAGKALGANRQAMKIALMTVMQECSMQPDYTTDENGDAGLFQNRPGRGDGTIAQLNDPYYALRLFLYGKRMPGGGKLPSLYDQPNWATKPEWQAAAWVQRPYKPYEPYYQKHAGWADSALAKFGYWRGTDSAASGWALIGERGRELVHMGGGETVLNNRNTEALLRGDLTGETKIVIEGNVGWDPDELAHELEKRRRRAMKRAGMGV